ncbi:MAG: ethylbenzene dehydrogenase-related protein [Candidatus Thorarchaeota archaeon]
MKSRNLYASLAILGFFLAAFFATHNIVALPDGITLMVYETTDPITLDGNASEAAWGMADTLLIPDIDGSGIDVTLKALMDETYVYLYATWNDTTQDDTRNGWAFNGTDWENVGGNEDRITLAWGLGSAIVCGHNPSTADGMLFDVWHWKAARTALAGWADDKFWDGSGRHGDAKTAGGYLDNSVVVQAANPAAITAALGNSSPVVAFSNDDRPYWSNSGALIAWTNGANSTPIGDYIHGYNTTIPVGSRGDVLSSSTHNGTAWQVEFMRALDTGNSADDVAFDGSPQPFFVAIHNNSGDWAHFKAGGMASTEFTLAFPASTTTTTESTTTTTSTTSTPTTTPTPPPIDQTLLIAAAFGGIVIILVIVVFVRRGR